MQCQHCSAMNAHALRITRASAASRHRPRRRCCRRACRPPPQCAHRHRRLSSAGMANSALPARKQARRAREHASSLNGIAEKRSQPYVARPRSRPEWARPGVEWAMRTTAARGLNRRSKALHAQHAPTQSEAVHRISRPGSSAQCVGHGGRMRLTGTRFHRDRQCDLGTNVLGTWRLGRLRECIARSEPSRWSTPSICSKKCSAGGTRAPPVAARSVADADGFAANGSNGAASAWRRRSGANSGGRAKFDLVRAVQRTPQASRLW